MVFDLFSPVFSCSFYVGVICQLLTPFTAPRVIICIFLWTLYLLLVFLIYNVTLELVYETCRVSWLSGVEPDCSRGKSFILKMVGHKSTETTSEPLGQWSTEK